MIRETPRLFLITPVLVGATGESATLSAALTAGDVACVLVRSAGRDERASKALLRDIAPIVQQTGAAMLIEADPRLAAHVGADGVQVSGPGVALDAAIDSLKPERIVGCFGLASRDDAMRAGEADVDYLMFGEPDPDGGMPDPDWTRERIAWWAEIFNVPCVGVAQTLDDISALALAGADFVALGEAVFGDARGPHAAVAEALAILRTSTLQVAR